MREGELCALKWKNVHLDDGYIHVDESVKRVAVFDSKENKTMQTLVLDPKSQKSIRDIDIPAILIDKLKELPHVSEYVFSNSNEPITHKSLYFQWQKVLKENNIPHKKFHALRHTYASTLLANGADLKSVQDLMGHYDISVTQVYLHSLPETKKKVVNIFDNL
ncbi:MAG: site-specific integrase [Clostridia bacterium]|nr:site-specific integrase [Clostridia bacterium]